MLSAINITVSKPRSTARPRSAAISVQRHIVRADPASHAIVVDLDILSTFVAPQFRTQCNFTTASLPAAVAEADDDLLALLGFKIWNTYGRVESPVAGYIRQGERSLGEMRPHY